MSLAVGTRLGPYEVLGLIGAGGMGEVYQAKDTRLDRTVAIKVLPSAMASDPGRRARFEREAKTIAGLTHPHICTLHDVGEYTGSTFLVMEHLVGETLAARLQRGALPLEQALGVATEIAEALDAAHKQGVIHRDLKPGNVMLTKSGVKLLDFGLAKLVSEASAAEVPTTAGGFSTGAGALLGTAGYMSPEQVRGEALDARTDLFSLGVVLYEMTTGRRPFTGDSSVALLASILGDTPPPVTTLNPRLPQQLDRIIRHGLAKTPDRRYQTSRDLRNDLEELKHEIDAGDVMAGSSPGPRAGPRRERAWLPAVAVVAAAVAILAAAGILSRQRVSSDRRSIAVLPLKNLSANPENEYFSDGITEDIIAQLSKLGDLRVIAATSVQHYKNSGKTVPEIGRELGVATLLEGSVRRAGDRVRIVSELVDARTSQQLWAETYDRDLRDIFAIQTEVSRSIAVALKGELSPAESARLEAPARDVDAFNLYLKGRYYWNERTPDGLKKAIDYFQQAIAKDPTYALAYAGLADSYNLLAQYGINPAEDVRPRAKEAATRALALDPTLAEAHVSQALIEHAEFGWAAAEAEYRRAIDLNPSYATAHHWYANYLSQLGRFDEAVAEIKRAQQLDPLSIGINTAFGAVLYLARRNDEAVAQLRTTLEMDPKFALAHGALAEVYIQKRAYAQALEEYNAVKAITGDTSDLRASLGYLYAVSGRPRAALQLVDELGRRRGPEAAAPGSLAVVYAALGQKDLAFAWLDKAYAERDAWLVFLKVEPKFDNLRSDPRFDMLLRRTGLER
jgi:serine/threonine protein kinase/tetratricopeptide (TPR) repeat protein